jgi:membrane fusion protein
MAVFFAVVTALFVAGLGIAVFGKMQIPLEGRGSIHPSERPTILRAQRGGRVALLAKTRGDAVKRDETIASFDSESDSVALASCQRELAKIRRDVIALDERAATTNAAVGGDVDLLLTMQRTRAHDRSASLEVRCNDLERAIANARVAAPIDGVVERVDVVAGDSIRDGEVVAAVARPGVKLIGTIQLPESRRAEIAVGRGVRLEFDAFPVERYGMGRGHIVRLVYSGEAARTATDKARDPEIVADVEIDELPRGIAQVENGMTFTGYMETEKTRLISFLLPSPNK